MSIWGLRIDLGTGYRNPQEVLRIRERDSEKTCEESPESPSADLLN